jgi:hypothetical protein
MTRTLHGAEHMCPASGPKRAPWQPRAWPQPISRPKPKCKQTFTWRASLHRAPVRNPSKQYRRSATYKKKKEAISFACFALNAFTSNATLFNKETHEHASPANQTPHKAANPYIPPVFRSRASAGYDFVCLQWRQHRTAGLRGRNRCLYLGLRPQPHAEKI